jgi:hypothetical protein
VTLRVVAVAATGQTTPLALAMLEDVVDLVEAMREVDAALAVPEGADSRITAVAWPGMAVLEVAAAGAVAVLDAVATLGAAEGTVVAPDAPDLPALLLGKLHSALTSAQVAVCPAEGGGLVAIASRLPVPEWLRAADPMLDDADVLARLSAAAPRRSFVVGAGWHRVRSEEDLHRLDPGLEGWEATRTLLDR